MIATAMDWKPLAAPFPYFGGKRKAAPLIWPRFGDDCTNYVEPFFGSGAVLLSRPPGFRGVETVNDLDCYLANFWRALQHDPDQVCYFADWPVNEADLHARHLWLLQQSDFRQRMRSEPEYYDVRVAGWWAWGACQWIGSGWCRNGDHRPAQQLPHLGDAGRGVHRPAQKLPHLGNAGMGVHRPAQKLPQSHAERNETGLRDYLHALAERLRRVRVCCGDWRRVCGPTPLLHVGPRNGICAVFLDPPYAYNHRKADLYATDDGSVSAAVRAWAIEHGNNPRLRICLAGYDGEHKMPRGWRCVEGKASAGHGYGGQTRDGNGYANRERERLWFSRSCLKV